MSLIKECLKKGRSQISKLLSSRLATVERVSSYPVAEEPDYYKAGGFHPISLGDSFQDGQYTILRKLGYGQYSTVWLAKDSKHQKYVALKVLRADCYGGHHDIFEREILSKILEVSRHSSHQGRDHVSHLLEQFTQTGPNGDHVCLAFDVLGHHLDFQVAKYEDGKLPVRAVKMITRQLLLALDFLHRECGIIHTDLKPTNILLELENPNRTISHYLSEVPARTDSQRGGTAPLREVIPTSLVSETKNLHVRLIDFGVASWKEHHLSDLIQSPALRAPEVTIGVPWDTGVDIWSLGCLVMELVQGIVLFSGEASSKGVWTAEDDHLARIIEVLGQFPLHFIEKGNRAAQFFDKQGNLLRIPNLKPTCLEHLVNGTTKPFLKPIDMPEAEVPIFVDFIKGMLEIDPGSRKPAAELLQHEWIRP
ncbi:protein kinase [Aspergillus transmontanensis]|uniref:non-specific serine/threonine protein kinase n=1 Tax=Aspergillus transmontanensis TaxID=1034304 RepID=A0A5N6VIH0_9EURO|nr:protein kinase [Aspergillus transmontanensis]